jgi:PAS domain S-box-containing protein
MEPCIASTLSAVARVAVALRTAFTSVLKGVLPDGIAPPQPGERHFRLIVDSIPGLVCTMSATGQVEFVNRRILEHMGMTLEQLADWPALLHQDDREHVLGAWNRSVETGLPYDVEHRIPGADGGYRWFHVRGVALRDADNRIVRWCVLLSDIDDRKRAEVTRQESERALRLLIESIPAMIAVSGPAGELEYINEHILDYTGVTLEDLTNLGWARVVHPEESDSAVREWMRSLQSDQPADVAFRIRRFDGAYRWFQCRTAPLLNDLGRVSRWYSVLWDVEDSKRVEVALQARERELRLLVDSVPGMVAVADAQGRHQYANKRILDYVRKGVAEVANLGWTDDIHPDDREAVRTEWLRCVENGEPMDIDHRWRRFDGIYRWFHARVEPLRDEQGRVLRWYGMLVDVDEWKRAEEALRRSQMQLAHVTRLTTVGELSASIAHEVNQPLTAVINNANACLGLLPDAGPEIDDVRDALVDIVEAAERASAVIERVRQLARRAPFQSVPLDVRNVIADVVEMAGHEATTRRVSVRKELADELPLVAGDRVQLQQVLLNLMVNGMDAMSTVEEPQRVLIVRGRCETIAGDLVAVLSVQDAGVGLTSEATARLFEPFYTTKPHGMGMGLAISRSIIEAHGGSLWAGPNEGPGTTFSFNLPASGSL